ncbi:MAG: DeoR/GlpR transcriptional regulator [Tenericutes bacterium HGW-Tenericutes-5]|nr:MAG: DeoR/GlpR transcriptional regulator [Tenericutes bacterium HGW-Tenericutes-5]
MLPYERKKIIEDFLEKTNETTIDEICSITKEVSKSTIRRDLKLLENEGIISVYYGGIIKKNKYSIEQKIESKRMTNMDSKQAIARYAASLVNPDETIFLDSGSTVAEMIKHLDPSVKVVTTSLDIVMNNVNNLEIHLLGGKVSDVRNSVYGISTIEQVVDFIFEKAFLGANGISEKHGITTPSIEESMLKKKIIQNSSKVYFLMDTSKIGNFSNCKIAKIDENYIIMEKKNQLTEIYKNIISPEDSKDKDLEL